MLAYAGFSPIANSRRNLYSRGRSGPSQHTPNMSGKAAASTLLDTTVAGTRALVWPYSGSKPAPEIAVLFIPGMPKKPETWH